MRYQNEVLPKGMHKISQTKLMNQDNIISALLNKHMSPKRKWAYLVILSGTCNFIWEDNPEDIMIADVNHPIIITPERFHRLIINRNVEFKLEFYMFDHDLAYELDNTAVRPEEE